MTGRLYESFKIETELPRFARWAAVYVLKGKLPPDLTRHERNHCYRLNPFGHWGHWACTRRFGHGGRHAAGDGKHIRAVW